MPDLDDGETFEIKGSGSKPYVIKNVGGVYSCSCPAWRNQSLPIERRTCKHIRLMRGDEAEELRLGAALEAPPRRAEGEAKEGPGVLLAESWDTVTDLVGWWMSEKLDGVRAYWDGNRLLSRNGNIFLAPDWFLAALPPTPLDGELWMGRKQFDRTSGIVRRGDRPPEWKNVRFIVFDAPAHEGEFEARLRYLDDLLAARAIAHLERLKQEECRGIDHLRDELARIEALGGEGLMMRQPGSRYVAGRSSSLLKIKTFHDAEAVVIGHEPGKGKHKGRLGALTAQLSDGTLFSIGTGFSDAERARPPALGSVVTFRYQERTERGVPRFPSFVKVRTDGVMTPLPVAPAAALSPRGGSVVVPADVPSIRTFEYGSGAEARIWEVTRRGRELRLRFGCLASLLTKMQTFATPEAAAAAEAELIAEKCEDGFVERGAIPAPAPAVPVEVVVPATSDGKRYFEFVEGKSSKFWQVWVDDCRMFTHYGRIGSSGTTTIKDYPDGAAAQRAASKMIMEKVSKGYLEKEVPG